MFCYFFHPKLQLAASQTTVLRNKQKLEDTIEETRKSLNAYKDYIEPKDDERICVLEAKKSEKEKELKKLLWDSMYDHLKKSVCLLQTMIKSRYYLFFIIVYALLLCLKIGPRGAYLKFYCDLLLHICNNMKNYFKDKINNNYEKRSIVKNILQNDSYPT